MNENQLVQPRITVLSSEQILQVHEYSLQILSSVGVRVDAARARRVFAQSDGAQVTDDNRVYIAPELVKWALKSAPSTVDIYDRHGNRVFRLGDDRARFGIGVTTLYYQNPETDAVTPFIRQHLEKIVRLGDALSAYDVISTPGIVQDVDPALSDLYATLGMVANTLKPLVILVSEEMCFAKVLDLIEHLQGDLAAQPFVIPYLNPITPLVINAGTIDKMWLAIERGLPFIYSNYGMAGASTPITPAGALAVLNAELLAGLVLSQLIKEGTPIILGNLPAYMDMKAMTNFYDAKSYLVNLAGAEMMAYYHLPHCGASGSGMGWGADLIAAGHQWINHLTSCLGKVGLAPFVGDNLTSKVFSPTVIVYANEIIQQARRVAAGFTLDDDAVAIDEISQVGPGGDFLTASSTLKLFREAYFQSQIFPNLTMEEWQARGCPRADGLLRDYTRQLIAEAAAPSDYDDLMARGAAFIADA